MRYLILAAAVALAGCGGGGDAPSGRVLAYAEGPIRTACLKAGRARASSQLCGCVQAAADASLSGGDKTRAARFYADPHEAQVVRQSDRGRDEAFWTRYKAFVARAERMCA